MDPYKTALLVGFLLTVWYCRRWPRALLWLVVGATDAVLTHLYFYVQTDWIPHPFLTGVTDALVAIAMATLGVTLWERLVRYCFVLSVGLSVCYLWGAISDRTVYAAGLELTNWMALAVIGGTYWLRRKDESCLESSPRSRLSSAIHCVWLALSKETKPTSVFIRSTRFG